MQSGDRPDHKFFTSYAKKSKNVKTEEINFDEEDPDHDSSFEVDKKDIPSSSPLQPSWSSQSKEDEINSRSVIIRNIDFEATLDEVESMFRKFGLINKVTMLCDKYTGKSKGTAYVEFENRTAKNSSMELNNQLYKNKVLRINEKKKEIPKYIGRREKCFNILMENYFVSTKNNFGPIKIKKSLKKRTDPY